MPPLDPDDLPTHDGLVEVLERARRLGFTGGASPAEHIVHALRFLGPVSGAIPSEARRGAGSSGLSGVDLGSGAGLPGLVLALALPESQWVLVEAMRRRSDPLEEAVDQLGLADRVNVWRGRAEDFGRDDGHREGFDVVVARGFASPATTAECAAPLLRPGGVLVVSEPPDSDGARWPAEGLEQLGLSPRGVTDGVMVCEAVTPCPAAFPRRVGVPAKRPLF